MTATSDPILLPGMILLAQEVHVWQADLDPARPAERGHALTVEEMSRACRYHAQVDRDRFIAGRGILRQILSSYLGVDAAAVTFSIGPFGKPYLSDRSLYFNLSHSGSIMLLALAREEIGIDLEKICPKVEITPIAQAYFSEEEAAELHHLPVHQQTKRFFELWTNKEALSKASGLGLAQVLDAAKAPSGQWTVSQIQAPPGYAAALALRQPPILLHYRSWT